MSDRRIESRLSFVHVHREQVNFVVVGTSSVHNSFRLKIKRSRGTHEHELVGSDVAKGLVSILPPAASTAFCTRSCRPIGQRTREQRREGLLQMDHAAVGITYSTPSSAAQSLR